MTRSLESAISSKPSSVLFNGIVQVLLDSTITLKPPTPAEPPQHS